MMLSSYIPDAYTMYKAAVENMSVNFTHIFMMVKWKMIFLFALFHIHVFVGNQFGFMFPFIA